MLSKKLEEELNLQIMYEFYSGNYYLSMASFFLSKKLNGFANFFFEQEKEERNHAFKFLKFINEKEVKIELRAIEKPKENFSTTEEIFKLAYEHEQFVTKRINSLMDLAVKENDHSVISFLKWFIDEQVEEEKSMLKIYKQLSLINNDSASLLFLDAALASGK